MLFRPAIMLLASIVCASPLDGQTVRGDVVDALTLAPIPTAIVAITQGADTIARGLTDADGRFHLELPSAGTVEVIASAFGYRTSDPSPVEIENSTQLVDVRIRLSEEAIEIAGLEVIARGLELRHRASFEGFELRHHDAYRVGNNRLARRSDMEFRTSMTVGDILKSWPPPRRCIVYYVDGVVAPGWVGEANLASTESLEGVEYYLDFNDAPLEFRGGGPPCLRSLRWSVIALWRRR